MRNNTTGRSPHGCALYYEYHPQVALFPDVSKADHKLIGQRVKSNVLGWQLID